MIWKERADGACSVARCHREWQTRYLRGSTELTEKRDALLCSEHEREFCSELASLRAKRKKANAPDPSRADQPEAPDVL